jgi:hypothetical protein
MPESEILNQTASSKKAEAGNGAELPHSSGPARWLYPSLVLVALLLGVATSFVVWGKVPAGPLPPPAAGDAGSGGVDKTALTGLLQQVNPPEGYRLPLTLGDLGPRLIEAGVIDYDAFAAIYQESGNPLTDEQVAALRQNSDAPVIINAKNAHFLLNFFWAVGLANRNTILTEGAMMAQSEGKFEGFASTGGWGLASKPVTQIYASLDLIPLTAEQQRRVEEAAGAIYRPCCDNPTLFPDCNHGMAMLGILELMAAQGATTDEMFEAAKYVNAFWFPQQTLETAIYMQAVKHTGFAEADARVVVGREVASGSGSAAVHQALQAAGLLEQAPGQGNSCAN